MQENVLFFKGIHFFCYSNPVIIFPTQERMTIVADKEWEEF